MIEIVSIDQRTEKSKKATYACGLQHFAQARVVVDTSVECVDAGLEELHAGAEGRHAALQGCRSA